MHLVRFLPLLVAACAAASARSDTPPPEVVPRLELTRYAGRWHEIARLPTPYQERCARDVTATYTPLPDGRVRVVNACTERDGERLEAEGQARRPDPESSDGRLEVRFAPGWLGWLPWVWADYWILALDPDYRHALVGTPDRESLWILARDPTLDETTYGRLVEHARRAGYPVSELLRSGGTNG